MVTRGYLDIETTGLGRDYAEITVIGLGIERGSTRRFHQLVGDEINTLRLVKLIRTVDTLYTYNGTRFDLPFIKAKLGIDLKDYTTHKDLMYQCWRHNLYGGLKKVETLLGITRKTRGADGWMAVRLWWDYVNNGNDSALALLLDYNKDDIWNLRILRQRLNA